MTLDNNQEQVKTQIEKLAKILLENSEKVAQFCIKNEEIENLKELLVILKKELNILD